MVIVNVLYMDSNKCDTKVPNIFSKRMQITEEENIDILNDVWRRLMDGAPTGSSKVLVHDQAGVHRSGGRRRPDFW
jgi:hypothetical protein